MSATLGGGAVAALAPAPAGIVQALPGNVQAKANTVVPLSINSVSLVNGALAIVGQVGNQVFTLVGTLTASPNPAAADCPILHLQLGPIHLNLLGLKVDTSQICLDLTAQHGGGLLGDLLCGVAGGLLGGGTLTNVLGALSTTNLNTVLNGLTNVLNQVLSPLGAASSVTGVGGTQAGACDILNLSLGPVSLNLLGLMVHLDNCANGPVTLDLTAVEGPGNLLGNLLCNLDNLLNNSSAGAVAIDRSLARIADRLVGALA